MAVTKALRCVSLTRAAAIVLLAGTAALGLAACSNGTDSQYCQLVEQNKSTLVGLSTDVTTLTADTVAKLRQIEAAAPSDIKGDWKTFNDYLQAVVDRDETKLKAGAETMTQVGVNIDKSLSNDCHITMPTS